MTISIGDPGGPILPHGEPLPEVSSESDESDFGQYAMSYVTLPPTVVLRPDAGIILDNDDYIPYERHFSNGDHFSGRIIPPPRWHEQPMVRQAASDGAVRRDNNGELMIECRSWLIPHGEPGVQQPRDVTIRAQLVVQLLDRLRRLWNDKIGDFDVLRLYVVTPTPSPMRDDRQRLHVLLERNRPSDSNLRPILMSFQEINAEGLSQEVTWLPLLVPPSFTLEDIAQQEQVPAEAHQLLVPQAARVRGWMSTQQQRQVVPGAYIPVWWDLRRRDPNLALLAADAAEGDEHALLQNHGSQTGPVGPGYPHVADLWGDSLWKQDSLADLDSTADWEINIEESVMLMQRGVAHRRGRQRNSPSTTPTVQAFHVFRITTHYMIMPAPRPEEGADVPGYIIGLMSRQFGFDIDEPASYHPIQATIDGLQNLPAFIYEHSGDRFSQLYTDDILGLVDIVIRGAEGGEHRIRRVLWLRMASTRSYLLATLRCGEICEVMHPPCKVFLNNGFWPEIDSVRRHFDYGDYIQVIIESDKTVDEVLSCLWTAEIADRNRRIYLDTPPANSPSDNEAVDGWESTSGSRYSRSRSREHRDDGWNKDDESSTTDRKVLQDITNITMDASAQTFLPREQQSNGLTHDNQSGAIQENDLRWSKPHVSDRWCAQPTADHSPGPSVRLCLDELIEKPILMNINCTTTRALRQQLLDFPIRPDPSMALVVKWHENTLHAMERTPYWIDEPVVRYHFYTDGSSIRQPKTDENAPERKGASAVILIVETPAGPRYGGSLVGSLQDNPTSPQTEIAALTLALVWAIQLGHHHPANGFPFQVAFGFDCTAAGNTAQGSWQINANVQDQWGNRALTQWLQQKHGVHAVTWRHIHSHQGHPWNEGADAIAWAAVNEWINAAPLDPLRQLLVDQDIYWVWFLEAVMQGHPTLPRLEGDKLIIDVTTPLTDQAHADQQPLCVRQREEAQDGIREEHEVLIRFATANVLTLFTQEDVKGGYVSARQEALLRQFASESTHVIGVQETRSTLEGYQTAEGFHILSAPATQQGVGGVQIWIAKVWKFGPMMMHIKHHHLRILHSTAQRLIVAIQNPGVKLIVVTGHAPPCVESETSRKWWNATSTAIPKAFRDWPTIYALDANARLGSITTTSVDDCGADDENEAGTEFHSWLLTQQCIAPQTFSKHHRGEHDTWTHPRGTTARIDYLVIDAVLQHEELRTWVTEEVDLALTRLDHKCVMMDLPLRLCVQDPTGETPMRKEPDPQEEHDNDKQVPWNLNVHDHAALLQKELKAKTCKDEKVQPRKAHLQPTTWTAIQWKKYCWKRCCQVRRTYRLAMLREMFNAWQKGRPRDVSYGQWLRLTDETFAWHQGQVLKWGSWTRAQVRHDDAAYYASFADKTTAALADEGLKGLWAAIKPVLPRQRTKRKQNIRCRGPTVNEIRDHFNDLEAGTNISYEELLTNCQQDQKMRAVESPICLEFSQIPSRIEMEQRILRQQIHKAPGLDRVPGQVLREAVRYDSSATYALMFKSWVLGSEPLQFKGGLLHMISKKAGGVRAQDMRGIMLLDGMGKAFHGLIRQRLLQWSSPRRLPSQFGGYQRQQTLFATQLLRSMVRTAQH